MNVKEILRYLVVGSAAFSMDMLIYFLLLHFLTYSIAKAISFVSGSVLAYILNKYWTFNQQEKSFYEILKFAILYISTLLTNVAVNKISLNLSHNLALFSFFVATGTSTILNFIGQKCWVFKQSNSSLTL